MTDASSDVAVPEYDHLVGADWGLAVLLELAKHPEPEILFRVNRNIEPATQELRTHDEARHLVATPNLVMGSQWDLVNELSVMCLWSSGIRIRVTSVRSAAKQ